MMNHIHTKNIFQAQFKIQKVSLSRFNVQHCSCRVEYVWYQVFYSLLLAAISFYPLYLFFFPVCLKASAPPTSFPTGKHIYSWLVSHDILSTNQNKNSHTAVEDSFWRSFSDHTAQSPHCLQLINHSLVKEQSVFPAPEQQLNFSLKTCLISSWVMSSGAWAEGTRTSSLLWLKTGEVSIRPHHLQKALFQISPPIH